MFERLYLWAWDFKSLQETQQRFLSTAVDLCSLMEGVYLAHCNQLGGCNSGGCSKITDKPENKTVVLQSNFIFFSFTLTEMGHPWIYFFVFFFGMKLSKTLKLVKTFRHSRLSVWARQDWFEYLHWTGHLLRRSVTLRLEVSSAWWEQVSMCCRVADIKIY